VGERVRRDARFEYCDVKLAPSAPWLPNPRMQPTNAGWPELR
jgi:hypothetical protein